MPSPDRKISESTVRRLSEYLRSLEALQRSGAEMASSGELARRAGTTAAQVRKDLSAFGSFGKRGLGYPVAPLIGNLEEILGLTREWRVALLGAGRIGAALHAYPFFRERGFRIVAIFDDDRDKIGLRWGDTPIRHIDELEAVLAREAVEIVILTVPAAPAPTLADRVAKAGVGAILNFAPARLEMPSHVAVNEVNLAMELELLSFALTRGESR
ncbi:MAG: redox-sensing transcriptional repressor Rex [Gemmatimonadales bacterium]|nr:MAG: redox-sensing transcriptional repressor Rex [Gemmatimonadales bacterium]